MKEEHRRYTDSGIEIKKVYNYNDLYKTLPPERVEEAPGGFPFTRGIQPARRMWAGIMKEAGATDERAMMMRFHTQTGGSTLTAQQLLNNMSRVTVQTLAAGLGGTQSLNTNGYDEALNLPTEEAVAIALCTQQIVAFESGLLIRQILLPEVILLKSLLMKLKALPVN